MKRLLFLSICLCLFACGSRNSATSSGISNAGSYTLKSASAFSTYSSGVYLNYTGMSGTLKLSENSWEKSISYRGNTTSTSGIFSSAYLNNYIGTFTMFSNTNSVLFSGSYQIDAASVLTLKYDSFLNNNYYLTLTETWIRN